jgi:hypothetical protein
MLPDGIFDTALKKQLITCFYTNLSETALKNVTIYLEGISDPGIVPTAHSYSFSEIPPGAAVQVSWLADFEWGTPGKKIVSLIAKAQGMELKRTLKQIFVSRTRRNPITGEYVCELDQGTLKVTRMEAIWPKDRWLPCSERNRECRPARGPWIPARMEMAFYPNPAYAGVHGPLPYGDPWWKIFAWIVAAIAALVAIIAAALGEGTAGTAVGGTIDETTGHVECCTPEPGGIPGDAGLTVAGVASAIATGAAVVGMSDAADPWWRGEEATPPAVGELTVSESVSVEFKYSAPLSAGTEYPVGVRWVYQRTTTGNTYTHTVTETQTNTHLSDGVEIDVPAIHHAFEGPLQIHTRFKRQGEGYYWGPDLYAFALLRSPDSMYFLVNLLDDGMAYDQRANDGVYTGSLDMRLVYRILLRYKLKLEGIWRIYVFAQDVNKATPDMLPEIAAQQIGGFMVASAIDIVFDPTLPCPFKAQSSVMVVE